MSVGWSYRFLLILLLLFCIDGGLTNNKKNLIKEGVHSVEDLVAEIDGDKLSVSWSYPAEEPTTLSSTTVTLSSSNETDTSSSTVILTSSTDAITSTSSSAVTLTSSTDAITSTSSSTVTLTSSTDAIISTSTDPLHETAVTIFYVYWDNNEDNTTKTSWETDEFYDGANTTVCVIAVKDGASSSTECTDAVDVTDDNLALILGLSIGIPVALCIIGVIIWKINKDRSSSNRRESDISIPTRRNIGQDNPQKSNDVLVSEFNKLKSLPSNRNSNIARRYKDKNPYTDVLPYDDTLVKLKGVEYMNASYILGKKFIVSPDPMPDQDNDIWQLIYECDVRVIVRISAGGEQKPMAQYIPDHAGDSWVMGADEVDINLQSSQQWDGYAENTLKLKKNGESRELKHFHLTNWPEGSAQNQKDQAKVLRLISSGRNFLNKPGNGKTPILIHCGAGSGRAGTLTGIWHLMDQHDNREQVNTYRCVEAMRKDRVGMVQNQEQYDFMYNCIMEYQKQSHIYRGSETEYGEYEH